MACPLDALSRSTISTSEVHKRLIKFENESLERGWATYMLGHSSQHPVNKYLNYSFYMFKSLNFVSKNV